MGGEEWGWCLRDCCFFPKCFLIRGSGPLTFGTEELLFVFLKVWNYQNVNMRGDVDNEKCLSRLKWMWGGRYWCLWEWSCPRKEPPRMSCTWSLKNMGLNCKDPCICWFFVNSKYYRPMWSWLVKSKDVELWMWEANCQLYLDVYSGCRGSAPLRPLYCSRVNCSSLTPGNPTKLWKGG